MLSAFSLIILQRVILSGLKNPRWTQCWEITAVATVWLWLPQHFTKISRFFNGRFVQLFMAGHEHIMHSEAFLVLIKLSSRENFSNYKTWIILRTIFGKAQNKHVELRCAVCCLAATRYQKLSMGLFNYLTVWIAFGWECDLEYD